MNVTCEKFLEAVDAIQNAAPTYKQGHSGDDGYCDCIGLIIGAIRRCGGKWAGIHGSNYAARFEIFGGLKDITSASQLQKGMAVFKGTEDTANLPSRYLKGGSYYTGDLKDYYHVGVVYSTDPLIIKHCTTGTKYKSGKRVDILEDTKLGKWLYAGKLTLVDYDGTGESEAEPTMENTYMVTADGGVNFRQKPNKTADKICTIPQESTVTGKEYNSEWLSVSYNGKSGYVMSKFLTEWESAEDEDDTAEESDDSTLAERISAVEKRLDALEKTVGESIGLG